MKLILKRIALKQSYTIGHLYYQEYENAPIVYICDTLEDQVRDASAPKIKGETAIPFGTFKIEFKQSPSFKRIMPYLVGVPNYNGVMIHSGNDSGDTRGCLLVGQNKEVGRVINSRKTFDKVWYLIYCKEVTITIE
jgi:hypothetical protein